MNINDLEESNALPLSPMNGVTTLRIKRELDGTLPKRMRDGDSCMDAYARTPLVIPPGGVCLVPLGFSCQLPCGHMMEVRPRSGLSTRGIICINGTVDENYRGEVCAILLNTTRFPFSVDKGDRVAQVLVRKLDQLLVEITDKLDDTTRGPQGFGSSGI